MLASGWVKIKTQAPFLVLNVFVPFKTQGTLLTAMIRGGEVNKPFWDDGLVKLLHVVATTTTTNVTVEL